MSYPNIIDQGLPQARALINALGNGPELEAAILALAGDNVDLGERARLIREEQSAAPMIPQLAGELVSQGAASAALGLTKFPQLLAQSALGAGIGSQGGTSPEGAVLGAALGGAGEAFSPANRELLTKMLADESGTLHISRLLEGINLEPGATKEAGDMLRARVPLEEVTKRTGVLPMLFERGGPDLSTGVTMTGIAPFNPGQMYDWVLDAATERMDAINKLAPLLELSQEPSLNHAAHTYSDLNTKHSLAEVAGGNDNPLINYSVVSPSMSVTLNPKTFPAGHPSKNIMYGDVVNFTKGFYYPDKRTITSDLVLDRLSDNTVAPPSSAQIKTTMETILHEMTHAAQDSLGLFNGANVNNVAHVNTDALKEVFAKSNIPYPVAEGPAAQYNTYLNSMGEQFARAIPRHLIAERSPNTFWDTYRDVVGAGPESALALTKYGSKADLEKQALWHALVKGTAP